MWIIIDIPEDLYEGIERRDGALETEYVCDELMKAVDNGTLLEQEPSDDLISREKTLNAFADYVGSGMSMDDFDALWNIVERMPPVAVRKEIGE